MTALGVEFFLFELVWLCLLDVEMYSVTPGV